MDAVTALIDRYVDQWNEPDPNVRRGQVADLWDADAMTCHRLQSWRGLAAIEERVATAHERWCAKEKNRFRRTNSIATCGPAIKFLWEMVRMDSGEVRSVGCSYLILSADRRIQREYQFPDVSPEPPEDLKAFLDRYLDVWNSPDPARRDQFVRELWGEEGSHRGETYQLVGHAQIADEAHRLFEQYGRQGLMFVNEHALDEHHGAVRFDWGLVQLGAGASELDGSGLLLRDEAGRIAADYQFGPFCEV
jgi:hypothetical protein